MSKSTGNEGKTKQNKIKYKNKRKTKKEIKLEEAKFKANKNSNIFISTLRTLHTRNINFTLLDY